MRPMLLAVVAAAVGAATAVAIRAFLERPRLTRERVLAEAATTYRYARPFFLVSERSYPFGVHAAFATRDSADQAVAASGGGYEVSGPYTGPTAAPPWEVLAVTVRVRTADGQDQTLQYDPKSVDAVFLTMQAVDKFLISYYKRRYGQRFADSVRSVVLVPPPPPRPPCHMYSFPCRDVRPTTPQN